MAKNELETAQQTAPETVREPEAVQVPELLTITVRGHEITVDPEILDSAELVTLLALKPSQQTVEVVQLAVGLAINLVGLPVMMRIIADHEAEHGKAPGSLPVEVLHEAIAAIGEASESVKN